MFINSGLSCRLLTKVVNKVLSLDSQINTKLQPMNGKIIAWQYPDTDVVLYFQFLKESIQVINKISSTPDLTIACKIAGLLKMTQDPNAIRFAKGFSIKGNVEVAMQLRDLMSFMDLDWQAPLADAVGETMAYKIGLSLKAIRKKLKEFSTGGLEAVGAYMQDDAAIITPVCLLDKFYQDTDHIRSDVDRLTVRIAALKDAIPC